MAYAEHLKEAQLENTDAEDARKIAQLKHSLQTTVVTNVFTEEQFKEQFLIVFETMAKILANTLGPYGSSTMIDEEKNYTVTKDGFHVLQNLRFADIKQNRIRTTLYSISHQMVAKVGDGSTSAVVAAYSFLKEMLNFCNTKNGVRPKELNERIQKNVDKICKVIANNATPVTEDNLIEVIRNVTNIATNENQVYTDIITSIYETLGANCTINISNSDTFSDEVVFEDGVYTTKAYLIDRIFHNKGNENYTKNCKVIMFDHVLDTDIWPIFETTFNKFCYGTGKTLIVIAPSYDQFLMDKMRKETEEMVRTYGNKAKIPFRQIFLKAMELHKPIMKDMYRDLAALLGATVYQPVDTKELISKVEEYASACREAFAKGENPPDIPQEIIDNIGNHIGEVDEAVMGDKVSSFKGFPKKNEALFNTLYHDAEIALKAEEERALRNDALDNKVFDARTRFTKISCKSATIKVGGANRLERSINFDAVDDAVKACASAIKYGYNQGCNLAIIKAVNELLQSEAVKEMTNLDKQILNKIRDAFINVYKIVLTNGIDEDEANDIIKISIDENYIPYNLAKHQFDESAEVINSCRTDIEILRGAIAMVAVVLTCNQYISSTLNH